LKWIGRFIQYRACRRNAYPRGSDKTAHCGSVSPEPTRFCAGFLDAEAKPPLSDGSPRSPGGVGGTQGRERNWLGGQQSPSFIVRPMRLGDLSAIPWRFGFLRFSNALGGDRNE
jgi:hypothetical protein